LVWSFGSSDEIQAVQSTSFSLLFVNTRTNDKGQAVQSSNFSLLPSTPLNARDAQVVQALVCCFSKPLNVRGAQAVQSTSFSLLPSSPLDTRDVQAVQSSNFSLGSFRHAHPTMQRVWQN
jgi:hypothetical protein